MKTKKPKTLRLRHSTDALDKAKTLLGVANNNQLAAMLGASPALVSLWYAPRNSKRYAPLTIDWAMRVVSLTGGAVTMAELLPDHARMFDPHSPYTLEDQKALGALSDEIDPESFV